MRGLCHDHAVEIVGNRGFHRTSGANGIASGDRRAHGASLCRWPGAAVVVLVALLGLSGCASVRHRGPGAAPALGVESGLPTHDFAAVVDRIAAGYVSGHGIAGLAVAVSHQGRLVYEAAYGSARLSPARPLTVETPLELFSVGKAATAALALRLEEQGVLSLDAPAGTLVAGLPAAYASATLRQLLRHSSGNSEPLLDEVAPEERFLSSPTRQQALDWISEGQRVVPPDHTWLYNGAGFVIVGMAAELATGRTYAELVRRELAAPLALSSYAYCPELDPVRSGGFMRRDGVLRPIPPVDFGWFGGAGSLCGTVGDLSRWWLGLRAGRLLGPGPLAAMTAPLQLRSGGATAEFGYGLGVRLGEYGGHRTIGHTGNGAGGTAALVEYPQDDLLVVVVANTAGEGIPHALGIQAEIARALLGIELDAQSSQAVPPELRGTAPGYYVSPEGEFCVTAGDESLLVATDGGPPVELLYQGDGWFRRRGDTASEEGFLGSSGRPQWFAYRLHGFVMDLARRTADVCP
jgi:CubicO group peptidase (beta-lactamase class C family)